MLKIYRSLNVVGLRLNWKETILKNINSQKSCVSFLKPRTTLIIRSRPTVFSMVLLANIGWVVLLQKKNYLITEKYKKTTIFFADKIMVGTITHYLVNIELKQNYITKQIERRKCEDVISWSADDWEGRLSGCSVIKKHLWIF